MEKLKRSKFAAILVEAVAEHRPVAIFFPDGHEIITA